MKNVTVHVHLAALLLALGFGNPSIGLGGDSCPPPNGCFTPTRWNFVNLGQKEKCGWVQFEQDPEPPVLKYYLRKNASQTIASSYSESCTYAGYVIDNGCNHWSLAPGPASQSWSISSSASTVLEYNAYSCVLTQCVFSGSLNEQTVSSDSMSYLSSTTCNCLRVTEMSDAHTNLMTTSITLTNAPDCAGLWTGTYHESEGRHIYGGAMECDITNVWGWAVHPDTQSISNLIADLSPSGNVTLYPPTQAIYNAGQNLTSYCGTAYTTTNTTTVTLSKEFTTLMMVGIAKEYAETTPPPAVVGGDGWSPFGFAFTDIDAPEALATVQKHWYYFEFPTETNVQYTVTWVEVTISDAGVSEHRRSWSTNGTGGIVLSPIFKIDPPPYNCFVFVADERVCPGTSPGSATGSSGFAGAGGCCGGGSASSSLGGPGPSLNGVFVQMGLGMTAFGSSAGTLEFQSSIPTEIIASPAWLSLASQGIDTDVVLDAQGQIRQVKSQQALADVSVVSTNKFLIRFFPASQIGAKSGGSYPTNGATEAVTWTIEAPNAASADYNTVLVTELRQGGTAKTTTFTFLPTDNSWTLMSPGNLEKLRQ